MPPRVQSKTVLIVEDDEPTRTMYRDALRHAGYTVVAVEDGLDALHRIEETVPDVVVLDLMLPRVGGWDVYKEMRANARTNRVPVLIVTGVGRPRIGTWRSPLLPTQTNERRGAGGSCRTGDEGRRGNTGSTGD